MFRTTFSSDLEEAMTESGKSLSNSKKYCSVLEKISKINDVKQNEKHPFINMYILPSQSSIEDLHSTTLHIYAVGVNINTMGMNIFLLPMEFYILLGNTFIAPLLMTSLCSINNNIINPCIKTINKHALDSKVHNTARFQWVYIDLVMDCVLTLR